MPRELERWRRLLAEAQADPTIHQAVLDAPPLSAETLAHIRSLIPPLGSHRLPNTDDGSEPDEAA